MEVECGTMILVILEALLYGKPCLLPLFLSLAGGAGPGEAVGPAPPERPPAQASYPKG